MFIIDYVLYLSLFVMTLTIISGIIEYYIAQNHGNLLFGLDWIRLWFIFFTVLSLMSGLIKLGGYLATGN